MMKRYLKAWETALMLALCTALLAGTWAAARTEMLGDGLLRLHVLARSDSEEDQAAKLRARDAVLELLTPTLAEAKSREEAEKLVADLLPELGEAACRASGAETAKVSLSRESYPVRFYGNFALPAGQYRSLRVELDGGAGHNWWCVVYPPLCMETVTEETLETGCFDGADWSFLLTEGEEKLELRFRVLELWGELFGDA